MIKKQKKQKDPLIEINLISIKREPPKIDTNPMPIPTINIRKSAKKKKRNGILFKRK